MATISNLGVGSGLDLNSLYSQLQTAEQSKLTTLVKQNNTYQNQISAYGKLKSSLESLTSATAALTKPTAFNGTAVTSTNTAFSATTDSTSTAGEYSVSVSQLATAQSLISGTVASNTDKLGTSGAGSRTLTIAQPGKDPLNITLSDDDTSLTGIRDAINKSGGNVSASIIKAKDGDYSLMLSSKTTGADSAMTVSVTGDQALQDILGYTAGATTNGMRQQTAGLNATLKVNGVDIERSSNVITDAPQGVTLQLKSVSAAGTSEQLVVSQSAGATKSAINAWVSAYNAAQATISSVTQYAAVDKGKDQVAGNGALLGNSTVRNVQTSLSGHLSSQQSGGAFSSLAQLGITSDPKTGQLIVDDTKLTAAISSNPQAVSTFFVGDGVNTGFATTMNSKLTDMTSSTGSIQNAIDGTNKTIKTLSDTYDAMSARIDATMAVYKQQFTALDTMMSKLNNTASYLASQFSSSSK